MNFFVIRLQSSIMFLQGKIIVTSFKYKVMIDKLWKQTSPKWEKQGHHLWEYFCTNVQRPQHPNEKVYRLSGIFLIQDHSYGRIEDETYVNQGSAWLKIWVVTGYHWLPEFWSQVGDRLPLVTRILVTGSLPLTDGDQNFGLRVVTSYHCLPEFRSQGGYRLSMVTRISVSGWLPVTRGNLIWRFRPVTIASSSKFLMLTRLLSKSLYRLLLDNLKFDSKRIFPLICTVEISTSNFWWQEGEVGLQF